MEARLHKAKTLSIVAAAVLLAAGIRLTRQLPARTRPARTQPAAARGAVEAKKLAKKRKLAELRAMREAEQQKLKARAAALEAAGRKQEAVRVQIEAQVRQGVQARIIEIRPPQVGPMPAPPVARTPDKPPTPRPSAGPDVVTTLKGDRLYGEVVGIGADGLCRLTGPQFSGEALIRVASLDRIVRAGAAEQRGQDEVALTNGDRVIGKIEAIAAENIVIRSKTAGRLQIPRGMVASVAFAGATSRLLGSNFASGQMAPWKVRGGGWAIKDGKLVSSSSGSTYAVYAELDQDEAVTFVANVTGASGHSLYCYMILFADSIEGTYGRNGVYARFRNTSVTLGQILNNGRSTFSSGGLGRSVQGGALRFAYDPQTGKYTTWIDSAKVDEHTSARKFTSGKYVIFIARYPMRISSLTVLPGVVPPSGRPEGASQADPDRHTVTFANKDSLSASSVSLSAGQLSAETSYGPLRCGIDKVRNIVFATKGRQTPRRRKGHVTVLTTSGRMTLVFKELTGEHLLGESVCYGRVRLDRTGIRDIRFNIYR